LRLLGGERAAVLLLLGASAAALAAAPVALAPSYCWVQHTTSQAAGQGVEGARLARLGFALFGFAVLLLTQTARPYWGTWGALLLGSFGIFMIATATFAHRHWLPDVPYDRTEDALHSFTATAVGFAFALGVLVVGIARRAEGHRWRLLDAIALASAVVIPLAMSQSSEHAGLLQRAMFLIAYIWFSNECLQVNRSR
jgi:hypothetical protein